MFISYQGYIDIEDAILTRITLAKDIQYFVGHVPEEFDHKVLKIFITLRGLIGPI